MCALKVAVATAKGMGMPVPGRLAAQVRALRLIAALALIVALAALAAILNGESATRSRGLIAAAIVLGCSALLGMAAVALVHAYRKKVQNDHRP